MAFCREFLESMNLLTNREATGFDQLPPVVIEGTQSPRNGLSS